MRSTRRAAIVLVAAPLIVLPLTACEEEPVIDLDVGDCFNIEDIQPDVNATQINRIPCEQKHTAEVYGSDSMVNLGTGKNSEGYPDLEVLRKAAETYCSQAFEKFVGVSPLHSNYDYRVFVPTQESWDIANDRDSLCVVVSPTPVQGTLKGAGK